MDKSFRLQERANRCIPNGVFGHRRSFAFVDGQSIAIPGDYPHFVHSASGCRFTDSNKKPYIDYLCGYGPMVVGYGNAQVDEAFRRQQERGLCFNFPAEVEVELAELLVEQNESADWAAFSINGTDAILLAVSVARAHTGRSVLIVAEDAYHGTLPFSSFGAGRTDADRSETRAIPWGDAAALQQVLASEPVAAVILCPYEQLVGAPNRMPDDAYWPEVRRLCDAHGTQLILDDIRSGFRLHPGGASAFFNIQPDMVCISKAIANGYPLAVTMGHSQLRDASEEIFVSGTFWGFAPAQAAALETIRILDETRGYHHMAELGGLLCEGLLERAAHYNHQLLVSGPPSMPVVLFDDDASHVKSREFATLLVRQGSLVHPTHNWFLCTAHQLEDINITLEHAELAFASMTATD